MARGYIRPAPVGTVDLGSSGEIQIGSSAYDNISILNADADVASGQRSAIGVNVIAKGTATVSDRVQGIFAQVEDHAGVVDKSITGAVTNGGLIRITCTAHTFATGEHVGVYGVGGTTEANGAWVVTVINANTFDLVGSTFTNAYTSGGTATNRPMMYGFFSAIKPAVSRAGLTGTAANGDDVNCYSAYNSSTTDAAGTDCYYIGHNTLFGSGQHEFVTGFTCAANLQLGAFYYTGRLTGAAASNCAIFNAGLATIEADAYAMTIPNAGQVAARNQAGSGYVNMFKVNTSNRFQIDSPTTMVTGASSIAMIIQDITTDATNKVARIASGHYTNSEEPVHWMQCTSGTSSSVLLIGGGSSTMNGATQIAFSTAANSTTVSGTQRLLIDSSGTFTFADGASNLAFGTTTGTKIGTAATQKIGFYNVTPIVQPSAYTQTFATADKTHAARGATALTDNSGGSADSTIALIPTLTDSPASADALRDDINTNLYPVLKNNFADLAGKVNSLITDLADTAGVVNALVDDLQALGLVA